MAANNSSIIPPIPESFRRYLESLTIGSGASTVASSTTVAGGGASTVASGTTMFGGGYVLTGGIVSSFSPVIAASTASIEISDNEDDPDDDEIVMTPVVVSSSASHQIASSLSSNNAMDTKSAETSDEELTK